MKKYMLIFMAVPLLLFLGGFGPNLMAQDTGWGICSMGSEQTKNLEDLRLLKLIEILNLSDKQSPQFISLFVTFRKEMRQINYNMQKEIDSLANLVQEDKYSETAVKEQIQKIVGLKLKEEQRIGKFNNDAGKILTPLQMGRVIVFQERFDRKLIEKVKCFRERNKAPNN
ncbi:MAG: hypothetical protein NTV06_03840 [candidate division Zixibacteria bacterium]|nr:hypothetical protein [candidate division Zixibacteria bacterium]